ncbi:MAG TPA: type I-F CRISPR-associated protein Csy2 [Pseudomonas xinjiangensis]|uniref:Type I-F CRISPR-associated protein Csy2 n=2 Tax=root TaxID=1 RepID=A0A7V1FQP0_9GAMM|nr:type I-F CRISPR-associated protein Csy2 [Halopseudomonas xinjiangensis]HEC47059.1 type I-F CRISPR-associated protein Csy2 [Halopseudomonas xinjiangensis]
MTDLKALLILPRLRVQSANAVSGPLTWGFPSPTAFTGFAHALERKLGSLLEEGFEGVGIICHRFEPQVFQPPSGYKYTPYVFCLTRNPVDKDGSTSALVEEGRAHLEVTLVIGVKDDFYPEDLIHLPQRMMEAVLSMRLAGGSILPQRPGKRYAPEILTLAADAAGQQKQFRDLKRNFLPGFALTLRDDKLRLALESLREQHPDATALDALLDLSRLNIEPGEPSEAHPEQVEWSVRKREGWLVPLPIGYAGLSELYLPGEVLNVRDADTPFRFVESIYSIGEWVSPHRFTSFQQLLWHTQADAEQGIYRCINRYTDYLNDATDGIA